MRLPKSPIVGGILAVIIFALGLGGFLWQKQMGGPATGRDASAKRQEPFLPSPTPAWLEYRYLYHGLNFHLRYPPDWTSTDVGEIGAAFTLSKPLSQSKSAVVAEIDVTYVDAAFAPEPAVSDSDVKVVNSEFGAVGGHRFMKVRWQPTHYIFPPISVYRVILDAGQGKGYFSISSFYHDWETPTPSDIYQFLPIDQFTRTVDQIVSTFRFED